MLQPFHDEEAEALRGVPPTPIEHLADKSVTGGLEPPAPGAPLQTGMEPPVTGAPSQAGLAPSSTPMMPPPASAFASGFPQANGCR